MSSIKIFIFLLGLLNGFLTSVSMAQPSAIKDPIEDLWEDVPAPTNEPSCRPLKPGQTLMVDQDSTQSNTGLAKKYKLTRDQKNPDLFIAEFNIDFKVQGQANIQRQVASKNPSLDIIKAKKTISFFDDETKAALAKRTEQCFRDNQHRLITPDGTHIELKLASASDPNPPPLSEITINTSTARDNSIAWTRNMSCATLFHEVSHLMGLCDGDQDHHADLTTSLSSRIPSSLKNKSISKFVYNCRQTEPSQLMMNAQDSTSDDVVEILECPRVDSHGSNLSRRMDSLPKACPTGEIPITRLMARSFFQAKINRFKGSETSRPFFYYRNYSTKESSLLPAQARMITMPLCNDLNENYISCAQNTYRTLKSEGCSQVPHYCRSVDFLK